jgi:hypothetical protein
MNGRRYAIDSLASVYGIKVVVDTVVDLLAPQNVFVVVVV